MSVREMIRAWLTKYRLPLVALARRAWLSRQTLYDLMNGKYPPRRWTIKKLARAMGVAPRELDPNYGYGVKRELIWQWLREHDANQRALARAAGLDDSTITSLLSRKYAPRWSTVVKLSKVLNVPLEELMEE